jgi:hypothetical protein
VDIRALQRPQLGSLVRDRFERDWNPDNALGTV